MKFDILKNGKLVSVQELGEGSHRVGRGKNCDLILPSDKISKQHAMIVVKDGKAAIVDLGSSNGVFVNGVLVRKQRIRDRDDVTIADYHIRISRSKRAGRVGSIPAASGNLAVDTNAESSFSPEQDEVAPQISPQEKLMIAMDEKVLAPLFGLTKSFDWRVILIGILGVGFLLSVLATVISVIPWGQDIATREAIKRAHTILGQLVRENYRILSKTDDYTKLTVEAGEGEPGILSISIIDPKANTIVAPTKLFNKSISNVHYLLAIQKVKAGETYVDIPQGDNRFVVAQPIALTGNANGNLSAIVLADFEVSKAVQAVYEPIVRSALFAILLILFVFYLISKMISYPIAQMNDQLDTVLKGEIVSIGSESKFPELESLATSINFAVSRIKQGSDSDALSQDDSEERRTAYLSSISEFDEGTSDGLMVLDKEKNIAFVGRVTEKLLNVESRYIVGQNVAAAIKDSGVAGTIIDLTENVMQSLGETQKAELSINGVLREMVAVGHRSAEGSIDFALIMVKMNEST